MRNHITLFLRSIAPARALLRPRVGYIPAILLALICFAVAVSPNARGVTPAPDGEYLVPTR